MRYALAVIAFCLFLIPPAALRSDDRERRATSLLTAAYPDFILGVENNMVLWRDGTRMPFDDGAPYKDWLTVLTSPDLQDQLSIPYPRHLAAGFRPWKNQDPGRIRYEPFFKKMYGATQKEVEANLTAIDWMPHVKKQRLLVTRINGVDKKLTAVSAELEKLDPTYRPWLIDIGGTYSYRTIQGTGRLSTHSYGIAIDLNVSRTEYWKWEHHRELDDFEYQNSLPLVIVEIFEKYGFIWGGAWYHYDTMHFEYRPELLVK
ncbi:MAG TPA: M15 family peptidase [Spirochaetia bacterium]|nr:M15 family peptidase [Spirochaetia bacterium]